MIAALKRVGATIVKQHVGPQSATYYLRVNLDHGEKWKDAMEQFLLIATEKGLKADVSKYFTVVKGQVVYYWRLVFTGDVEEITALFASCAIGASTVRGVEVTSIPLVGRLQYQFDPARGKLKGGHDINVAPGVLSMAIGAGGPTVAS